MQFNFFNIVKKIICFVLIAICIGFPVTNASSFILLFISGLVIVNGLAADSSIKRLAAAIAIAVVVVFVKGTLPHAGLQEGHNIFFTKVADEILERGLPPDVFNFMKEQFLKKYPLSERHNLEGNYSCWHSKVPQTTFVFSADSVFSNPKYSRIVDEVNFRNLTEFRGGFVNNLDYNWYGDSDIKRESMPFFVMYELSPASVNSYLCWTGYLLWEGPDGHYQPIYNKVQGCRKITDSDIGKKVFGVAINNKEQLGFWGRFKELKFRVRSYFLNKGSGTIPEVNEEATLSMRLNPFWPLKLFMSIRKSVDILSVILVLALIVKVDRKRLKTACLMIMIAAIIAYLYCPHLFGQYYIHEGAEDGITHETFGRGILADLLSGNWLSALRGGQDVFWDTPGFRYFRAVEKLFFGDTDFGYLAVVLILPYALFGFLMNFISKRWSFWVTIFFLFGVFFRSHALERLGLTYHDYVMVVRGGWPDSLAYTAFIGGITLALRYVKVRDGSYLWYGFLAHFLFFITVFMRPQLCLTALIAVLYFAVILFREGRTKEILVTWTGFLPVLFPLLHNYLYGGRLVLFTGAIGLAVDTPPSVYFNALKELLALNYSGRDLAQVAEHMKIMIGSWYRVVFLAPLFYAAFAVKKVPSNMRMIAVLCLSLHFVNLFICKMFFRYVFLTWALTVVVSIFLLWLYLTDKGHLLATRKDA